jgi:hypothetical protein
MHPILTPTDPEARLVRCPDCGQLEVWAEAELQDHGRCRTRPGTPCACDYDPDPAPEDEVAPEVDGMAIAQKLGLSLDELNSLYTTFPVGGCVGAVVAQELRARYGLDEDERLGEALAERGVLTEAEGRWLDDRD